MIRKETLDEPKLIELSLAVDLQAGFINEIYLCMRKVVACVNHEEKRYVLFVIYDGEILKSDKAVEDGDDLLDLMDDVFAESLTAIPDSYDIELKVERVDFPTIAVIEPADWECIIAFHRHEELDWKHGEKKHFDL